MPTQQTYLTGFFTHEKTLLKKCLGDSDFDTSNNQDTYNWDYGSKSFPHLIKLVRDVSTLNDGGYYAVLYWDPSVTLDDTSQDGTFMLLNPFYTPDEELTDVYNIYTTKGTLALTSNVSEATFGFGSKYVYMANISYDTTVRALAPFDGDISCERGTNQYVSFCLQKNDLFFLLNWEAPIRNPPHLNMYTAERLYTTPYQHSVGDRFVTPAAVSSDDEMHFMTHVITTDISTNWGAAVELGNTAIANDFFHVYKFFPSEETTYEYVSECSGRGTCNTATGLCKCFSGYTSDACNEQISVNC